MSYELEVCIICWEPTGRAGKADDSMYCAKCGKGPLCLEHAEDYRFSIVCPTCYDELRPEE